MDAISRAISEAASNEDGKSAIHWLLLEENGKDIRTTVTEGELAQLRKGGMVRWDDELNIYVMTAKAKQALKEEDVR